MVAWNLVKINIKDLKPHPSNPRRLTKDQYNHLKISLDKFGLIDKPIVNCDNTIIGGHQRYMILKKDKAKEIECWMPDHPLTDDEVKELMVRLNRNTGEFDFDLLANDFELTDLLEWGFNADDLDLKSFDNIDLGEEEEKPKKLKECPHCGGKL